MQQAKPRQSLAGLINISFGFFGIQIGFALQNANMSRVFQTLGSAIDDLPALWIAAPLTGLLVQPIIGHLSDKTWLGRLGRRRPFFLMGAVLAGLSLFGMPIAETLLIAAVLLWILDASLNISMEPFRAFVGDMLPKDQHTLGYGVQTAFIGAGAVVGSLFPWFFNKLGVANEAAVGVIPDTVRYSFWAGAIALVSAVLWTVITTREYSADELASFQPDGAATNSASAAPALAAQHPANSLPWMVAGVLLMLAVANFNLQKEIYLLGGLIAAYGVAKLVAILLARSGRSTNMLASIVGDFSGMPLIMKRLAVVQFFSWSALFIMWINTSAIVAQYSYGTTDASSAAFQEAGNWTGVLFAVYNGVAAVAALALLPLLSKKVGQAKTHAISLLCGAAGYASFMVIRDPSMLIISEVGIGIAWASILAMPYAILASSLPQAKLGTFMGLFNIFVVVPQLLVATVMGSIMGWLFPTEPIWTMLFAAVSLVIAAIAMQWVKPEKAEQSTFS